MLWRLQEAKQKFSQLVKRAQAEGPQIVTRRGQAVAVVLSAADYEALSGQKEDFIDFLLSGPELGSLQIERSPLARDPLTEQPHEEDLPIEEDPALGILALGRSDKGDLSLRHDAYLAENLRTKD